MLRLLALSSEAAAERESNPYLDHGSLANLLRSRHLGASRHPEMLWMVHDEVIRSQLEGESRIGVIRYQKSGSSPLVFGTMRPGLRGSFSLKRTFSESTAETPSSR